MNLGLGGEELAPPCCIFFVVFLLFDLFFKKKMFIFLIFLIFVILHKLVMKRHSEMGANDKMTFEPWSAFIDQDASVTTMIFTRYTQETLLSTSVKLEVTAVLTHQRPTKQTGKRRQGCRRNARKHAEARVRRHDNVPPIVPSHLRLVHMSAHKQWVQVVDMSLVICGTVVHCPMSGSDGFASQHLPSS